MDILREDIFSAVNGSPFELNKTSIVRDNVFDVDFYRDENLDLIFKLKSRGSRSEEFTNFPAGTIRHSDGAIELTLLGGAKVRASNVVHRGSHTHSSSREEPKTVDTYTAHQVELSYDSPNSPAYTVEWVGNLADRMIFPDNYSRSLETKETVVLGKNNKPLEIKGGSEAKHFSLTLYLKISEIDIYILHDTDDDARKHKRGTIIYGQPTSRDQRDKIRSCISFAFGLPILLFGETEFSSDWVALRRKSYGVHSMDGAAFKIAPLHPYPIHKGNMSNVLDPVAFTSIVVALLEHYDDIKFNELLWIYWHAMCAPVHSAAVQMGGAIEQLQRNAPKVARAVRTRTIEDEKWKEFSRPFVKAINEMDIDEISKKILMNKISNLNQAPQSLVFKRMIDNLGLSLSKIEEDAWRHRNTSAHGVISGDHISAILSVKLLRMLFHKFLAGITYCSDRYIDYYSLGFPIRALGDEIPPRS